MALAYGIGTSMVSTLGYYCTIYYVCRGNVAVGNSWNFWMGLASMLLGFCGIPVYTKLSRLLGKKKAMVSVQICAIAVSLSSWWLYTPAIDWLQVFYSGFTAFTGAGFWILYGSMTADVIDYDELETSKRREGAFSACASWILKLGVGIGSWASGEILSQTGFDATLGGNQTPHADLHDAPALCRRSGGRIGGRTDFPYKVPAHTRSHGGNTGEARAAQGPGVGAGYRRLWVDDRPAVTRVHSSRLECPAACEFGGYWGMKILLRVVRPRPCLGLRLVKAWSDWIRPMGILFLVIAPLKSAVVDWNWVPSGSMKPTIMVGDLVLVNKLAYDLKLPFTTRHLSTWAEPARGDIVVFFSPRDGTRLVKRVVALPGDSVELREDVVLINGARLSYSLLDPLRFAGEFTEDPHPLVAAERLGGRTI